MEILRHDKVKLVGDLVDKFLELKPEYTGAFWNAYEFAEIIINRVEELEIEEFEKSHLVALEEQYRDRFGELPF